MTIRRLAAAGLVAAVILPASAASADPIAEITKMVFAPGSDIVQALHMMKERAEADTEGWRHWAEYEANRQEVKEATDPCNYSDYC